MKGIKLNDMYITKEDAIKKIATGEYMILNIAKDNKYLLAYVPYIPLIITKING